MARCIVAVDCADHSSALSRLFRVMEDSMKELVRNGGGWRQPVAAFYVWATIVLCEASTRTSCGLLEESHAKVIAVHIASNDIEIQTHYSPEEANPTAPRNYEPAFVLRPPRPPWWTRSA